MTDSTPPPPPAAAAPGAPLSPAEDKQWASFAHLGGILGFLPALIIWLIFKDRGQLSNSEGKEALNFQITIAIAYVVGVILSVIVIGGLISLAAWVVSIIFSIIGFTRVNAGGTYRYPFAIRFIK